MKSSEGGPVPPAGDSEADAESPGVPSRSRLSCGIDGTPHPAFRKRFRLLPALLWVGLAGVVLREKSSQMVVVSAAADADPAAPSDVGVHEGRDTSAHHPRKGDAGDLVILDDGTIEVFGQHDPLYWNKDDVDGGDAGRHGTSPSSSSKTNRDIIVVVAVDGTLAGISKATGHVLWKHSEKISSLASASPSSTASSASKSPTPIMTAGRRAASSSAGNDSNSSIDASKILQPLVSTSTTTKSASTSNYAAVPSVDGTVYTTSGDMTVSTSVKDLVERAPFLDPRGRFYVGSRHATAAAVDGDTGQILRVVSASPPGATRDRDGGSGDGDDPTSLPTLEGRNVVWVGRVDYHVSVQDARTGMMEAQFSVAEVISVADMHGMTGKEEWMPERLSGSRSRKDHPAASEGASLEARRRDVIRRLGLPAPDDLLDAINAGSSSASAIAAASGDGSVRPSSLVATPNGNLALWDFQADTLAWVADESFSSPIAFAIDAATGSSIGVDIIPDVPDPNADLDNLAREMQRQMELAHGDESLDGQTIVGAMSNGQLYALPLGGRKGEPSRGRTAAVEATLITSTSSVAAVASTGSNAARHTAQVSHLPGRPNANFQQGDHHSHHHSNEQQHQHHSHVEYHPGGRHGLLTARKRCIPSSQSFPGCLVHHDPHYSNHPGDGKLMSEAVPPLGIGWGKSGKDHFQDKEDASLAVMTSQFHQEDGGYYHPSFGYVSQQDLYRAQHRTNNKFYKSFFKVLTSWLPPTIALLFVVSFELGRRKRLKDENKEQGEKRLLARVDEDNGMNNISNAIAVPGAGRFVPAAIATENHFQQQHVISVSEDVLGYGGHGTVVYKGFLDGREVAVKRMLKAYHASADREISLLIESDGHPNVVRYFLKEVRGDFVYLALELCDLSLHDLIGVLRERCTERLILGSNGEATPAWGVVNDNETMDATKRILLQIASGVKHLHSLRIVHRDLKPANILLAISKRDRKKEKVGDFILDTFNRNYYDAKISDMGLGKQLLGQSSIGVSLVGESSFRGSKGAVSSIGVGPGSVGWQAPEVMALRLTSDVSTRSMDSHINVGDAKEYQPNGSSPNPGTSRSVDIFSLGCIFYSVLIPGSHPFGEWFEREANIMHNRPNLAPLKGISVEAYDLIRLMVDRNPRLRPTAKEVCQHPFFWSKQKKLTFLCDFSDRLETDCPTPQSSAQMFNSLSIERGAMDIVGTSWEARLDGALIDNVQKFRSYDYSCIRDLLRLIRNKHHHFDELPDDFRKTTVPNQETLIEYFQEKFPGLVMHSYNFCRANLRDDDTLISKYEIIPSTCMDSKTAPAAPVALIVGEGAVSIDRVKKPLDSTKMTNPLEDLDLSVVNAQVSDISDSTIKSTMLSSSADVATDAMTDVAISDESVGVLGSARSEDIIVWEGSAAAKTFNCRGWSRSDDEWSRHIEPIYRKRDPNLKRCMDDPKFRTRLCNHWDVSLGTECPMRKKNKCVFAHGPAELRIKEGKKNRWGKLVDKNGNNSNPWHSGGEDTFGAASSIEKVRKDEGKWNTGKEKKAQGILPNRKKQGPSQSKSQMGASAAG